jgi:hypothetical protein
VIIRRNTPIISIIVLVGIASILIGSICHSIGAYHWSCLIDLFMVSTLGSLVVAGIIAKNYRIYKIFRNKSATALVIKDSQLFFIIGAIFLYFFLIFILGICTRYSAYQFTSEENRFYLYIECSTNIEFWTVCIEILVHVSSLIFKLFALVLAWLTRKVVTTYSESYEILIIISIYFCVDIATVPLFFELQNGTNSAILRLVLVFVTIFITSAATLLILFYSRFYYVYKYEKKHGNGQQERNISSINTLILNE